MCAAENWQEAHPNFDPYKLSLYAADDGSTPRWDEITEATSWQAYERMLDESAQRLLDDSMIECEPKESQ